MILFAVVLWRTFSNPVAAVYLSRRLGITMAVRVNRGYLVPVKLLKTKTVRFAEVIEKAGKPEPYTLWQKPATDKQLQSALKNHRVMTIQQSDTGTEFGMVGFKESKVARYLIFPKSLKRFEDNRIVGIKWDLVEPG